LHRRCNIYQYLVILIYDLVDTRGMSQGMSYTSRCLCRKQRCIFVCPHCSADYVVWRPPTRVCTEIAYTTRRTTEVTTLRIINYTTYYKQKRLQSSVLCKFFIDCELVHIVEITFDFRELHLHFFFFLTKPI